MNVADELDMAMRNYVWPGSNPPRIGISQPELAKISNVPQPTISRTLKGKSTPETKTLLKLAEALGVALGGYTGIKPPDVVYRANDGSVVMLEVKEFGGHPPPLSEIVSLARTMSREGQFALLGSARELAKLYPAAKANPAS